MVRLRQRVQMSQRLFHCRYRGSRSSHRYVLSCCDDYPGANAKASCEQRSKRNHATEQCNKERWMPTYRTEDRLLKTKNCFHTSSGLSWPDQPVCGDSDTSARSQTLHMGVLAGACGDPPDVFRVPRPRVACSACQISAAQPSDMSKDPYRLHATHSSPPQDIRACGVRHEGYRWTKMPRRPQSQALRGPSMQLNDVVVSLA